MYTINQIRKVRVIGSIVLSILAVCTFTLIQVGDFSKGVSSFMYGVIGVLLVIIFLLLVNRGFLSVIFSMVLYGSLSYFHLMEDGMAGYLFFASIMAIILTKIIILPIYEGEFDSDNIKFMKRDLSYFSEIRDVWRSGISYSPEDIAKLSELITTYNNINDNASNAKESKARIKGLVLTITAPYHNKLEDKNRELVDDVNELINSFDNE